MLKIYGYEKEVNPCAGCESAKKLLQARAVPYEFHPIASKVNGEVVQNAELIKELQEKTGRLALSAPIIFDDETFIGGFMELRGFISKLSK